MDNITPPQISDEMTPHTETDRELLELAAKAAGLRVCWHGDETYARHIDRTDPPRIYWNPLTDDGDALRLAVKLQLRVIPPEDEFGLDRASVRINGRSKLVDSYDSDPYAATRRAIVRAAAEIGRAMR